MSQIEVDEVQHKKGVLCFANVHAHIFTCMCASPQVRQLEHEKEITVGTFDTRSNELMHLLACTRDDLSAARTELERTRLRAEMAEAR